MNNLGFFFYPWSQFPFAVFFLLAFFSSFSGNACVTIFVNEEYYNCRQFCLLAFYPCNAVRKFSFPSGST
uniref:Uncharacterized protein n=1 Tax=Ixodes ricinus TaxID=34613 RepID=A0A6B0TRN7_IXORI